MYQEVESRFLGLIEKTRLSGRFDFFQLNSGPSRTNSTLFLAENRATGERQVLKISSRTRIQKAVEAFPQVKEYFPTPEPVRQSVNTLLYPYVEGQPLDQTIRQNPQEALLILDKVYQATLKLWEASVSPYNPQVTVYNHRQETRQTIGRLREKLVGSKVVNFIQPVAVNGIDYPSLMRTTESLMAKFSDPIVSVLDPGDANSQNIIVTSDGEWCLVDLEKTGRYDPAYILARQLGQWFFFVDDPKAVSWKSKREVSKTIIDYDPNRLKVVDDLINLVRDRLGGFLKKHGDVNYEERLKAYFFVFFARYAVLSESWILRQYGRSTAGPLLTEAILNSSEPIAGEKKKLAIVIVNYNTGSLLKECLDSVEAALTAEGIDGEVVVVDNRSADNSLSLAKPDQRKIVVRVVASPKNLGFARATNLGIGEIKADFYLLLNPDTVVCRGSLGRMLEEMKQNPGIGALGPLIKRPDGGIDWRCRRQLRELGLLGGRRTSFSEGERLSPGPAETISGACMLMRRDVIDQVGLLDEDYFLGIEDVDWCYRIGQATNPESNESWRVYFCPEAEIIHWGGQSRQQEKYRSAAELVRSMVIFANKNICPQRPRWQRPLLRLAAFAYGSYKAVKSLRYWSSNR